MGGKKRDRWDSSSDEEEDTKKEARVIPQSVRSSTDGNVVSTWPIHNPLLQGCRSVYDTYEQIERLSEGSYGIVWKARDLATNETVALKQIKFHVDDEPRMTEEANPAKNGFPVTALREISVLLALSHENIVHVREMVTGCSIDKVFMVMQLFDYDLSEAMSKRLLDGAPLPQSELKGILQQVLQGTHHMHTNWYLHRDLKPSNVLVEQRTGRVALADLGLARRYQTPARAMTQLVVTLWYRSPELLFGESCYGPPVDMWSIGCVFGELILGGKEAVMPGQGELDQIDKIFSLLGGPNETTWPSFDKLPNAGLFRWKSSDVPQLSQKFPVAQPLAGGRSFLDADGFALLEGLLALDPSQRLTATNALQHPYFQKGVKPRRPQFV
ncbi:cell division cycle 2-like [Fistulifera solaris]|uniref:Cyclin-dependent kinase 2 homolog n=1 Tax=Fistulifera solaris TaxID=1519565 RepID=A0A1Z5JPG6_FISSO|nr:cell division cycle 2-like [Fistulifera solaris]|eukprot:GAX15894.1 cell division cycle 2-like [Fistulifera solaris]